MIIVTNRSFKLNQSFDEKSAHGKASQGPYIVILPLRLCPGLAFGPAAAPQLTTLSYKKEMMREKLSSKTPTER